MTDTEARGRSFQHIGADYHRVRPTYSEKAVDWMLPPQARRVLDLGAGTGKLTDALVARDLDVVAVDPSAQMLAVLAERHPDVETHVGTAEALPLPDQSVDAVLVGQAWQYVDPTAAGREIARVLRPGGRLAMAWNVEQIKQEWLRTIRDLQLPPLKPRPKNDGDSTGPYFHPGPQFTPFEDGEFPHVIAMTGEEYIALCKTSSHWLTADEATRAQRTEAWEKIRAEHDPGHPMDIDYVTIATRTDLT